MTTPADRFRSAASRFSALVTAVPEESWDVPSRCEDWSIRDVVDHVVSTERDFLAQRSLDHPDVEGLTPQAACASVLARVQQVMDDPSTAEVGFDGFFGPTTIAETVDRFYTLDLVVHRWDIASALGLDDHAGLDAAELAAVEASLSGLPDEVMRSPGLFGPAVEVPADAPLMTRVLAHLGRG